MYSSAPWDEVDKLMEISSADVAEFEGMSGGSVLEREVGLGIPPLYNSFAPIKEEVVERNKVDPESRPELYGDARYLREVTKTKEGANKRSQPPGGFTRLDCSVDGCKSTSATRRRFRVRSEDGTLSQVRKQRPYRFFHLPSQSDPNEWIDFAVENQEQRENWKAQVANCQVLGIGLENCPFRVCERHFRTAEPTPEEPNPVHIEPVPYHAGKSRHSSGDSKASEQNWEENDGNSPSPTLNAKTPGYEYLGNLRQSFKCLVRTCPIRSRFRNPMNEEQPYRFFRVPFKVTDRTEIFKALKSEDPDFVVPTPKMINHICERHFDLDDHGDSKLRVLSPGGLFPILNLDPESNGKLRLKDLHVGKGEQEVTLGQKLKPSLTPAGSKEECRCTVRSCFMANGMKKPSGETYKLYRMPASGDKRQEWYEHLKRADPDWEATRWSSFVCERHFENGDPSRPPSLHVQPPDSGPSQSKTGKTSGKKRQASPPTQANNHSPGEVPKLRMLTLRTDPTPRKKLAVTSSPHQGQHPIVPKLEENSTDDFNLSTLSQPVRRAVEILRPQMKNWCCQTTKPLQTSLARVEGKINCLFGMLKTMAMKTTEETGKQEEFDEIQVKVEENSSGKIDSIFKTLTEQVDSPLGSVLPKTTGRPLAMNRPGPMIPLPPSQFRDTKSTPLRFLKTSSGAHILAPNGDGARRDITISSKLTGSRIIKVPTSLPKTFNTGTGICDSVSYQQQPVVCQTPEEKLKNFQKLMGKATGSQEAANMRSSTLLTLSSVKATPPRLPSPSLPSTSSAGGPSEPRKFKVKLLRRNPNTGQQNSGHPDAADSPHSDMPSLLPLLSHNPQNYEDCPPNLFNESMDSTVSSSSDIVITSSGHSNQAKRLMTYRPGPKSVKKRRLEKLKEVLSAEGSSGPSILEDERPHKPRPSKRDGQAMATVETKALQDLSELFRVSGDEICGGVEGESDNDGPPPMTLIEDSPLSSPGNFNRLQAKGNSNFDAVIGRGILMFRGRSVSAEYLRENGRICFSNLQADEIEQSLYRLCFEGALKKSVGSNQTVIPVGHRLFHKIPFEELPNEVVEKYQLDYQAYVQEYNAGKGTLRGIRMGRTAAASSSMTNQMVLYQKMMDRKQFEAEEEARSSCNDVVESNFEIDPFKQRMNSSLAVASSIETSSSRSGSNPALQQLEKWKEGIKRTGYRK